MFSEEVLTFSVLLPAAAAVAPAMIGRADIQHTLYTVSTHTLPVVSDCPAAV